MIGIGPQFLRTVVTLLFCAMFGVCQWSQMGGPLGACAVNGSGALIVSYQELQ